MHSSSQIRKIAWRGYVWGDKMYRSRDDSWYESKLLDVHNCSEPDCGTDHHTMWLNGRPKVAVFRHTKEKATKPYCGKKGIFWCSAINKEKHFVETQ